MKTVENNLISILSRLMCKNTKWVKKHLVKDNCSYVHSLSRFPFLQLLILVQIYYFQIMTFIHHAQFIYLQQYCPLRFERKCIGTGTFTFFCPENSDCVECVMFSLPCIKFNLNSGVFERRTATGSKTSYLFVCLDATTFVFIKYHYSYRDDLPENLPKNGKSPLPVGSTYSDIPFLKCILNHL